MFIYALNTEQRKELLLKGFEEINSCKLNGDTVYVFINAPSDYATFSKEDQSKFLVTDVAYFI